MAIEWGKRQEAFRGEQRLIWGHGPVARNLDAGVGPTSSVAGNFWERSGLPKFGAGCRLSAEKCHDQEELEEILSRQTHD